LKNHQEHSLILGIILISTIEISWLHSQYKITSHPTISKKIQYNVKNLKPTLGNYGTHHNKIRSLSF